MSRSWPSLGAAMLWFAASALAAVGDERGSLMRQPMTSHGAGDPGVRAGRTSLDAAGSEAHTEDRPGSNRVLMNACAGKNTPAYWVKRLRHHNPDTRVLAAQALGEMRDPTVVPALVHALKDPDRKVRVAVVQALGRIGPGASVAAPVLREMLAGTDAGLRDEASRSLERITATNQK